MGSVNKVILVGNLGRDAELRYTPGGAAVATLNMATTEVWNDKAGQRQEKTEWHRVVLWGKIGRIADRVPDQGQADLRRRPARRRGSGTTRTATSATPPRSAATGSCCSAAVAAARGGGMSRGGGEESMGGGQPSHGAGVVGQPLTDDDIPF